MPATPALKPTSPDDRDVIDVEVLIGAIENLARASSAWRIASAWGVDAAGVEGDQPMEPSPWRSHVEAMNRQVMARFSSVCAGRRLQIESLDVASAPAGRGGLVSTVTVKGRGSARDFREAHDEMLASSPDIDRLTQATLLTTALVVVSYI